MTESITETVNLCDKILFVMNLHNSQPIYYLNQRRVIVNWKLRNKLRESVVKIENSSFTKMYLKVSSAKWRSVCPGVDDLIV